MISIGTGSALNLNLYNYFETNSFSPQSFINTGSIAFAGGSLVELTDGGTFPTVAMLNASGARIKGFGTVDTPVVNNGVIESFSGTLALNGAVSGTGTLDVYAGTVLDLSSVSTGQTATFGGAGGVLGLSPPNFLGVINGFAVDDTIDLADTAAKSATFSGASIVVTLTAGGTFTLATTSALTGTLSITAGTHNDTLLKYSSAAVKNPKPPVLKPLATAPHSLHTLADFTVHPAMAQAEAKAALVAGPRAEIHNIALHWVPMLHG